MQYLNNIKTPPLCNRQTKQLIILLCYKESLIEEIIMSLAYCETDTINDHTNGEGDWELIDGKPCAMASSPFYDQQFSNLKIARQLGEQLDNCPHCHAVIETDVSLSDDTVVRLDTMVICYEPKNKLDKARSLIFEAISKSTARRRSLSRAAIR